MSEQKVIELAKELNISRSYLYKLLIETSNSRKMSLADICGMKKA